MLTQIGTLIVATSLIQLANGFFNTFISLRVGYEAFGPTLSGLVLSSYFAGFTLAASSCERVIERVGHIRAYAAFAGMVVCATALMPLIVGALPWLGLRAVVGFGCAGLFVATESWLNAKASAAQRGLVFSVYMIGTFLALALGQLLIAQPDIESTAPFHAIVTPFAAALVMVSLTRTEPPLVIPSAGLPFGQLSRAAPAAVAGAATSGFVGASFYALVPAWMQEEGVARDAIAVFMLVAVLGGLAFQFPVGRLSDRLDRRLLLAALSLGFAVAAVMLVSLPHSRAVIFPTAAALGGFMSTLYPVCVANAHDQMPADRVVAVSGRLILVSGIGSILGPLVGTGVMAWLGIDGLFYLLAAATLVLAALAAATGLTTSSPPRLERTFDVLTPQATLLAHDAVHAADNARSSAPADE